VKDPVREVRVVQQPRRFFKYLNRSDVHHVFDGLTLKFSDSEEVRENETGGAGFGDAEELLAAWAPGETRMVITEGHPFLKHFPDALGLEIVWGPDAGIIFGVKGSIFCLSGSITPAAQARWKSEFGYDAFFQVLDLEGLLTAMDEETGLGGTADWVSYRDVDVRDASQCLVDPFRKAVRFSWQDEYRFVSPPVPKGIIRVPSLLNYIGPVEFF
jgi:hypothetical protein